MKKIVSGVVLTLLLIGMLSSAFNIQPVKAEPKTIIVPDDYSSIQEAINAAKPGDTIYVKSGIYYENIIVNKDNLRLIGENRETTIIDGGGQGTVVKLAKVVNGMTDVEGVIIEGFTIRNSGQQLFEDRYGVEIFGFYNTIRNNIITNNNKAGVYVYADKNRITKNVIANNDWWGVFIATEANDNEITGNNITNNVYGIQVMSARVTISENYVIDNEQYGILLDNAYDCVLKNNHIEGSKFNFAVLGGALSDFLHDIDSTNTVNGRPIYYLINRQDEKIPTEAGYVALINSRNITVENLSLENNWQGILLFNTNNTKITGNNITKTFIGVSLLYSSDNIIAGNNITKKGGLIQIGWYRQSGIRLVYSSNNTITENNIIDKWWGLVLSRSSHNTIYHNNFIDLYKNTIYLEESYDNTWDNGYPSGGNYWSDYNGTDFYSGSGQDEAGSDGIGDVVYEIDADNRDRYPLMGPFTSFDAGTWNGEECNIYVVSNSTVSNFQLNTTLGAISFNVTGVEGTAAFCRITIPNIIVQDLWQGNYTVLLNGEPWPFRNWTDTTSTYIYINYTHSEHQIVIIPQLPSSIALLEFLMLITIPLIFTKKRQQTRKTNERT